MNFYRQSFSPFHNILRLLDVFSFHQQVKRSTIISNKHGIYELSHGLPNDLIFRILGN